MRSEAYPVLMSHLRRATFPALTDFYQLLGDDDSPDKWNAELQNLVRFTRWLGLLRWPEFFQALLPKEQRI